VTTNGFAGFYFETRDYVASSTFWRSLGYAATFETDHGSGQWEHPAGGPYVFISQQPGDAELASWPILAIADSSDFAPDPAPRFIRGFEPQHWHVAEALIADPDGRTVSLHAPLPAGATAPDATAHHAEKYG
jgi:hypothetical protein